MRIRLTSQVGQYPVGAVLTVDQLLLGGTPSDRTFVINTGVRIPGSCAVEVPDDPPRFEFVGTPPVDKSP